MPTRLSCALLLALVAACGDGSSDPTRPASRYTLRELNDSTLPYDHEGLGCCTYLSGELSFDGREYAMALTARNRNTGEVFTPHEWGKWAGSASSLRFARDSFAIIGFLLDVATLSGDSLRVRFGGEGPGSPDQFRAVFVRATDIGQTRTGGLAAREGRCSAGRHRAMTG